MEVLGRGCTGAPCHEDLADHEGHAGRLRPARGVRRPPAPARADDRTASVRPGSVASASSDRRHEAGLVTTMDHQPDAAYFDTMARHARTHWWYEVRRARVEETLAGVDIPPGLGVDVGSGTGHRREMLARSSGAPAIGTDLSTY